MRVGFFALILGLVLPACMTPSWSPLQRDAWRDFGGQGQKLRADLPDKVDDVSDLSRDIWSDGHRAHLDQIGHHTWDAHYGPLLLSVFTLELVDTAFSPWDGAATNRAQLERALPSSMKVVRFDEAWTSGLPGFETEVLIDLGVLRGSARWRMRVAVGKRAAYGAYVLVADVTRNRAPANAIAERLFRSLRVIDAPPALPSPALDTTTIAGLFPAFVGS